MTASIGKRAVVVGAGIGGLTAARALADHFEQVIVLDRDVLPDHAADRAGTPQSRHVHGLLAGGQNALGELFPGFEEDLVRAGAASLRFGLDIRVELPGYDPFPRRDLGRLICSVSRPLIELVIRRHVEQHANITFHQRWLALELLSTPDGAAVTAVRCRTAGGRSETLPAELVVDASGRGTLTLALLESTGLMRPDEAVIGVDIGYATAIFARPDDAVSDWKAVVTAPQAPECSRRGIMLPIEHDRWMVSVSGRRGEKPSGDGTDFLAFAGQLRTPTIYNAIRHSRRLGEVARFGFPKSVWRHFEKLKEFPRGLLPIADAICRFNPVYGQGMSVAARQACLLGRLLRKRAVERDPLAGLALAFFADIQALIETPWSMAAGLDLIFPGTQGQRPPDFETTNRFRLALLRLAARDADVHKLTNDVQNLLKPPSVYRDPELRERVLAVMAEA